MKPQPQPSLSMEQRLAKSRGGRLGGNARREKLSPERRAEIARQAAQKRWSQKSNDKAA